MKKKMCVALRIHSGRVEITDYCGDKIETAINLPPGCVGMCFAFESKTAARNYWGRSTELIEIKRKGKNNGEI